MHKAGGETKKFGVVQYVLVACVLLLLLGVGVIATIVVTERSPDAAAVAPPKTIAELLAEREAAAEEAEKTATWQTFHCNLLYRYYDGPEPGLPVAELLGIDPAADQSTVDARCKAILPQIEAMGGWPTGRPAQDNFVVCDGFEFVLSGKAAIRVRPRREDLAENQVAYAVGNGQSRMQALIDGHAVRLGQYVPTVIRVDDRCIVVASLRYGRKRAISGRIVRAVE